MAETHHVRFTESKLAFKRWWDHEENCFMHQCRAEDYDHMVAEVEKLRELLEECADYCEMELDESPVNDALAQKIREALGDNSDNSDQSS